MHHYYHTGRDTKVELLDPLVEKTDSSLPPDHLPYPSQSGKVKDGEGLWRRCADLSQLGLLLTIMSSFLFSVCCLFVKVLVDVTFLELVFFRYVGIMVAALGLLVHRGDPPLFKGSLLLMALREILNASALMLKFYALKYMPLGDASVIMFSVPVFVVVFAWIFLGEPCTFFQGVIFLITMAGIVLIVRPPFLFGSLITYTTDVWWGVVANITSTIINAATYVLTKILKDIHYSQLIFGTMSTSLCFTSVIIYTSGHLNIPQYSMERFIILCLCVLSFFDVLMLTRALQLEKVGLVSIAKASDVVFAFFWQAVFFQEVPDFLTWLGFLLIMSGILFTGLHK